MTIDEINLAQMFGATFQRSIFPVACPLNGNWKIIMGIVRASASLAYPKVGIKAFTAVEVEWAARIS